MENCVCGLVATLLAVAWPMVAAEDSRTPHYSAEGITSAASYEQGRLAPFGIGTIFGEDLSNITRAVAPEDAQGGQLPTSLPGADVHVYQDGSPVGLFYVSPTQINFLVRATLLPGKSQIRVVRGVISGPSADVTLTEAAPAFFQLDETHVVASHADGSVILPDNPAHPGEIIVLWVTGLGRTYESWQDRSLCKEASEILLRSQLEILFDGEPIDDWLIKYAGTSPGFAGLYQINVELPRELGPDPEISIRLAGNSGRAGLHLLVNVAAAVTGADAATFH